MAFRLVGIFIYAPIFATAGLGYMFRLLTPPKNKASQIRIVNLMYAALIFVAIALPFLWIAREALYGHYFRFLLDTEFSNSKSHLYNLGSPTKFTEAINLLRLIFVEDLSWQFGVAVIAVLALAPFSTFLQRNQLQKDRSILFFLTVFALLTFLIHWSFKIKSDHLTRMTAAPIFLIIVLIIGHTLSCVTPKALTHAKRIAILVIVGLLALANQVTFYQSTTLTPQEHLKNNQIVALFEEIYKLTSISRNQSPGISTDFIDTFELGGLYIFNTYAFERHGALYRPNGQLGFKIDEQVPLDDLQNKLNVTDIFVLTEEPIYKNLNPIFPFAMSMKVHHEKIAHMVRDQFCFKGSFKIGDQTKSLYVKPSLNGSLSTGHLKPCFPTNLRWLHSLSRAI